jgi:hypothetical protein
MGAASATDLMFGEGQHQPSPTSNQGCQRWKVISARILGCDRLGREVFAAKDLDLRPLTLLPIELDEDTVARRVRQRLQEEAQGLLFRLGQAGLGLDSSPGPDHLAEKVLGARVDRDLPP